MHLYQHFYNRDTVSCNIKRVTCNRRLSQLTGYDTQVIIQHKTCTVCQITLYSACVL